MGSEVVELKGMQRDGGGIFKKPFSKVPELWLG